MRKLIYVFLFIPILIFSLIFTSCGSNQSEVDLEMEFNSEIFSFKNDKIYYNNNPYSGIIYGNGIPPYKLIDVPGFDPFGVGLWTSKIEKGSWSNFSVKFDGSSTRIGWFGWNPENPRQEKMTNKSVILKIEKKQESYRGLYYLDYYFIINETNSNDSIINTSIRAKATTKFGIGVYYSSNQFIEGFTTSIFSPENYLIKETKGKYGVSKHTPALWGRDFASWAIYGTSLYPILTSAQALEEKREKERRKRISNCRTFVESRIRRTGNIIQTITQENFPNYTYIVLNSDNLKNYIYRVVVNNNCDDIQSTNVSPMN